MANVLEIRDPRKQGGSLPAPKEGPRWLVWLLRFLAYAIPLGFLLYVLYWNFLPFGYEKTFTIDVGSPGDTSGEFYLEPSRDLSERKTALDGTTYRELNGIAYAVFKPKAVLKNAQVTVSVEGGGVSIIPPVIDFDPDSVEWDYSWDFTDTDNPYKTNTTGTTTAPDLMGNAFQFDGCMYFDGNSRLELPDSADTFEDGPFTVYAEWTPADSTKDRQQIMGHYNWEIWQDRQSIEFQIGRVNNAEGDVYAAKYSISNTEDFFADTKSHRMIATYHPNQNGFGYIQIYVDGKFGQRINIGKDILWNEYGSQNLTLGWTNHNFGKSPFFKGRICDIRVETAANIDFQQAKINNMEEILVFPIMSSTESAYIDTVQISVLR